MKRLKVHPLSFFSVFRALPFLLLIPTIYLKLIFLVIFLCYSTLLVCKKRVFLCESNVMAQSGVLIKQKSIIKKEKITAFSVRRGPLSYIFRAATLKLYTNAEKRGTAALTMQIYKKDIESVYEYFGTRQNSVAVKTPFIEILWASAATSSAFFGFLVAMPFFSRAEKLFGVGVSAYLIEKIGEISQNVALPTFSGTIFILLLCFYFLSFIINLCKNLCSKAKDLKTAFLYTRGAPVFEKTVVFKTAVGAISFVRPFVLRIFGRGQIAVPSSAFNKNDAPLPNAKICVAEMIAPCIRGDKRAYAAKNTLYRFLRWRLTLLFCVALFYWVSASLFPFFSQFIGLVSAFLAFAVLYLVALAFYSYKTAWISQNEESITINAVYGFAVKRVTFSKKNISEIKITRYPSDIKENTCTIKITAYPTGESAKIKCITDNFSKLG